jgi:hypothetical protein
MKKELVNIHHNATLLSFSFDLGYVIAMNKDNNKNNNSSNNYFSPPFCDHCKNKVSEIYQDNGDYCLECWQKLTCPKV